MQNILKLWIYKLVFLLVFSYYGLHYTYTSIYESRHLEPLFSFNSSSAIIHVKREPGFSLHHYSSNRSQVPPMKPYSSILKQIKNGNNGTGLPLCPEIPPNLRGRVKLILQKKATMADLQEEFSNSSLDANGRYKPKECEPRYIVAIVVPYRDRFEHLNIFIRNIHPFLQRQQLDYTIFIVEQAGEGPFNRAMLFNVGFVEAMKIHPFDCFIFHDVDLLPEDDRNIYSCPEQPRHMSVAVDVFKYKLPYHDLFGGVCAISSEHFEYINGFSNMFWGWGGEDDDMASRIKAHGLHISRYPNNIARYTMLKHKKQAANPKSDTAMKQFLLHLDETEALGQKFILHDLDETRLFISPEIVETLQARIDELMDQISFPVDS